MTDKKTTPELPPVKKLVTAILNRIFSETDSAKLQEAQDPQPERPALIDPADVKDQVVREILDLRLKQIDAYKQTSEVIEQLALDALERLNQITGAELAADEAFSWFSADELVNVKLTTTRYAVPTESWHQAKHQFAEMLKAHNLSDNAELKPFLDLAAAAFDLTEGGRADVKAIARLRRARFDVKKYPEWRLVRAFLADSIEYVSRRAQFSVAIRDSKKHYWQKLTNRQLAL